MWWREMHIRKTRRLVFEKKTMRVLVFGAKGLIGSELCDLMRKAALTVFESNARVEDEDAVRSDLRFFAPDRVVSCTGRTSGGQYKTIDYLEQKGKLVENVRDNLFGPVQLAMICKDRDIHCTIIGTGCIFNSEYDEMGQAETMFQEDDKPNFFGSAYSTVKGFTDQLLQSQALHHKVLNVRIRMPYSDKLNERNTLTKLISYPQICSLENSITTFSLFPYLVKMVIAAQTGTINLCNPGPVDHETVLQLYKQHVDPTHTFELVSREQLFRKLPAERSNTVLDTSRLEALFPDVPCSQDALEDIMKSIAASRPK